MASTTTMGRNDPGYDMSLWYDSRPLKIGWFTMLAAVGAEVVFQRVFGYSHGLDSMTPEFETVWMGLWRFNVISNIIFSASCIGWIWQTRDRNVANVDPKTELKRYFYFMMWGAVYVFGVYWACLLYTSDAADERSSVDLGGRRIIKKKKSRIW